MMMGGQRHAPIASRLGMTRYPFYGRLGGPQGRSTRVRKISPYWIFFFVFSCKLLLFVLHPYLHLCLDCPESYLLSILTTHNTNIHALGGIRTHKPTKRSAPNPRLRRLGHWDRLRSTDPSARIESLYRLCYPGPLAYQKRAINTGLLCSKPIRDKHCIVCTCV
jgi:hypothetical protein